MCWLSLTVALATPDLLIPVQGVATDATGVPLEGTHAVHLRLYGQATGGTPIHDEPAQVAFQGGTFAAWLGAGVDVDISDLLVTDLHVTLEIGGAETARVPVAWAPRAAVAATLEGHPAADFVLDGDAVPWSMIATAIANNAAAALEGVGLDVVAGQLRVDDAHLTAVARAAVAGQSLALAGIDVGPTNALVLDTTSTGVAVGGTLSTTGAATLGSATVQGAAAFQGGAAVTGNLTVSGGTTLGTVSSGGDLTVYGAALANRGIQLGGNTGGCSSSAEYGTLRWNGTIFQGCTSAGWTALGGSTPGSSQLSPAANCKAIKDANAGAIDGYYWLTANGLTFQAWCDQTNHGGGWTLVANVSSSNGNHYATRNANNTNTTTLPIPYEDSPGGRKLADATMIALGVEGVVRVQVGSKATPAYYTFFQYPSGFASLNHNCQGNACPRIRTSHVYPLVWESSPCGGANGYQMGAGNNYWVYDNHDNTECGAQFSSSQYPAKRVLYGYAPTPNGIYANQQGYTWVR